MICDNPLVSSSSGYIPSTDTRCRRCWTVQVAAWLGVGDVGEVMEQEGLNPEYEMGRTQGLGLGAKFLPHNKVCGHACAAEPACCRCACIRSWF